MRARVDSRDRLEIRDLPEALAARANQDQREHWASPDLKEAPE